MTTKTVQFKHRIIHALSYELILFLIGTPILSHFFEQSLTHTGLLWILMTVLALIWNVIFNIGFEHLERQFGWRRTVAVRILHAVGFEGGLVIFTVPVIVYMLHISWLQALLLDIGMAVSIMVYTFIFQWCYDGIMAKWILKQSD